jgi:hypothetical protein
MDPSRAVTIKVELNLIQAIQTTSIQVTTGTEGRAQGTSLRGHPVGNESEGTTHTVTIHEQGKPNVGYSDHLNTGH